MLIQEIRLQNFKPFEKQTFTIKPLTLLSGLNSTGKSSLLQSLLLLRQSYKQDLLPKKGLALNGDLVKIGTAKNALYEQAKQDSITFCITWNTDNNTEINAKWECIYNQNYDVLDLKETTHHQCYKSSLFQDNFHYLEAERICPKPFFEMNDFLVRQHRQLGSKGEYTAHFLSLYQDAKIPNQKLQHSPDDSSLTLRDQVETWIGEISPGTRIKVTPNYGIDAIGLQFSYGLSNDYRPTNVGFGITYTLPILVAVLSATPGTLIILENPEAHLHPKGQAKIGKLLALAASCGVQIIVETHSDHILNGIRLAVHDGNIEPDDVQLHYFERKQKKGMYVSEVRSPNIDKNGRIDDWPPGFFDEWRNMLAKLI